jgi:hypothetical protein
MPNSYKEIGMSTLGGGYKHRKPRTEEHKQRLSESGKATRAKRKAEGRDYSTPIKESWSKLTPEERSERTAPGRQRRKELLFESWPTDYVGDPYGGYWPKLREKIFKRDKYRCIMRCEKPGKRLEAHHVCYDPTCRDETHILTLCSKCHQRGHRKYVWPLQIATYLRILGSDLDMQFDAYIKRIEKAS